MIINRVELNNIGPYVGRTVFDLKTDTQQNIVLIGGKNGSGKTTLLQSIKFGLFGSLALGYKTNNSTYYSEIKKLLNTNYHKEHSIEIEVEMIEKYQKNKYVISRKWNSENEVNEKTEIWLNDIEKLKDDEMIEFFNKIKHLNSNVLINSFIFDGEHIASIIENGEIDLFIRDITESLFNINLLSQTSIDLKSYLKNISLDTNGGDDEKAANILSEIDSIKLKQKAISSLIFQKEKVKNGLIERINHNIKEIFMAGGITKKQIKSYEHKLNTIYSKKDEDRKTIKNYIETKLPIQLIFPLLIKAKEKITTNQPKKLLNYLYQIQDIVDQDLSDSIKQLKNKIFTDKFSLELNDRDENDFNLRYHEFEINNIDLKSLLRNNSSISKEYRVIKKVIDTNNYDFVKDKLKEREDLNKDIYYIDIDIERLREEEMLLNSTLSTKYHEYNNMIGELSKDKNRNTNFLLATKTIEILELYKQEVIEVKLKKVSKYATEVFNNMHTKGKYVKDLHINTNYSIDLIDINNKKINLESLSAGEKQLLVASIIFSMYKVSNRNNVFIFDTPLARLDKSNRKEFINNIIKKISKQVVLLSTDSEFIGENLTIINNNINKKYNLVYIEKNQSTILKNGYFGDQT